MSIALDKNFCAKNGDAGPLR